MGKDFVRPSLRPSQTHSTHLSILDNTVVRYAPTGGIWIFNRQPQGFKNPPEFVQHLKTSLSTTLNSFPHWAGQLHWAPFRPNGTHTERFNRTMVSWGTDSDPGVEWTVVDHSSRVSDVVRSPVDRALDDAVWIGNEFPQQDFISSSKLPMADLAEYSGLSAMLIRVTLFADGGYALGIKMAHPLADAQSLITFMHHWAATSQKQSGHPHPTPITKTQFDPSMVDAAAYGDIDGPEPDETLVSVARGLPRCRFDWWATDAPGYPGLSANTKASTPSDPALLARSLEKSPADPAPWTTWNMAAPVTFALVHFTGAELSHLREKICNYLEIQDGPLNKDPQNQGSPSLSISRLDAVLAHVWQAINRARSGHTLETEDKPTTDMTFLHLSLGARTRLSPPLPESFIGSPIFQASVQAPTPPTSSSFSSVASAAAQIRRITAHTFTRDTMGAMLHELAHEVAPQRIWNAFLGSRHTLVTSWLRLGIYNVSFGADGVLPTYVHAVLPKMDGCIQIMDSGCGDGGMDVAMYVEKSVAERVLEGGVLRPWYYDGSLGRHEA